MILSFDSISFLAIFSLFLSSSLSGGCGGGDLPSHAAVSEGRGPRRQKKCGHLHKRSREAHTGLYGAEDGVGSWMCDPIDGR